MNKNKKLIFKERPSNTGIFIGSISKYNSNKGHITFLLEDKISIGDTITKSGIYVVAIEGVGEIYAELENIDGKVNVYGKLAE